MAKAGAYPYEQRYWYPHMSPAEAAIWHRFIRQFPDIYDSVDYDVKVGSVPDFIAQDPDPSVQAQGESYRYKIDVIGYKGDQIDIIELKQGATMRALGQVTSYRDLYLRDIDPSANPKRIVITDRLMPDMDHLAAQAGVQMVVV